MSEEEARSKKILKLALPLVVLLLGAGATAALILSRQAPERVEQPVFGPLVEVMDVEPQDLTVKVDGQGEVGVSTRVEVFPEVAGRVIAVHLQLVAGGHVGAGETLVQIDRRDYELAVASARAVIASSETRLEQERAEAEAALAEWRQVNPDTEPPSLLVREPQIHQLEAEKAAAEAQLARAELDLERTRLSLPFDAVVLSENVDPGQYLTQGRAVAMVYGTKSMEVRVPLDDADLRWFDLPAGTPGPPVEVSTDFAGAHHTWKGRVVRLEGEVDPKTRMVHVVVRVDDPFAIEGDRPPLLPGTFVDVVIEGRVLENVVKIPRYALRQGGQVWTFEDGLLRLRGVEVLRSDRDFAYLGQQGLEPGTQIVTSALEGVTDGMSVRVAEPPASTSATTLATTPAEEPTEEPAEEGA